MIAMTCPHCHDTEIIRSGRNASGTARFRCKACGKTWVQNPQRRKLSAKKAELIVAALAERVSQRGIARALRVRSRYDSRPAKKNADRIEEHGLPPTAAPAGDVLEVGEIRALKYPGQWLWLAVSRSVKQVLGFGFRES